MASAAAAAAAAPPPALQLPADGSLLSAAQAALQAVFGHAAFRTAQQRQAVEAVLRGQ